MNDKPIEVEATATPVNPPPMTGDEIRSKIIEQFTQFEPAMKAYHEYAERQFALSIQYHDSRLSEVLGLPIEQGVILASLDARETPKSLDAKIDQLKTVPDTKIRRIVFDRVSGQYHLFI